MDILCLPLYEKKHKLLNRFHKATFKVAFLFNILIF